MQVRLHSNDIKKLEEIADKQGSRKTILIRTAVKEFIAKHI